MGIAPSEFWGMTPWQFRVCGDARATENKERHNLFAWLMWNNAALSRHAGKKFPALKEFLFEAQEDQNKKPVSRINENAIMAWLQCAAAKFKNSTGET